MGIYFGVMDALINGVTKDWLKMDDFTCSMAFDAMKRNHTEQESQCKHPLAWSILQNFNTGELILYSKGNVDPELVKAALTPIEPDIRR